MLELILLELLVFKQVVLKQIVLEQIRLKQIVLSVCNISEIVPTSGPTTTKINLVKAYGKRPPSQSVQNGGHGVPRLPKEH